MYVLALAKWTKRYMDPTADTICGRSRNFKIELIIIRSLTLDIMTINDLWLRDTKTVTTASLKFLWLPVGLFWCTCEDKSWPRVLDLWFFWTFFVSSRQVLLWIQHTTKFKESMTIPLSVMSHFVPGNLDLLFKMFIAFALPPHFYQVSSL